MSVAPAVGAAGLPGVTEATADTPVPTIYWGALLSSYPPDLATIGALDQSVGKGASIVQWGEPWFRHGAYQGFQVDEFEAIRKDGHIPLLDWGSWDPCCGPYQSIFELHSIASGLHDAYLTNWARAAKAWGHPFFLRFDPEMNGKWSTWSEQVNNNDPGDFVLAWRHVVSLFRAVGATNVTWVWCPNISGQYSSPLEGLYPGDDYVDWTCMDGYNWGTTRSNEWQTFTQVFGGSDYNGNQNTYQQLLDLAPSKPIMIGETASAESGGDKAAWIDSTFNAELVNTFPQVRAILWFDWDANDPELEWSIDSSPEALAAFAAGVSSPTYASNDYANIAISPIRPPDALPSSNLAVHSP